VVCYGRGRDCFAVGYDYQSSLHLHVLLCQQRLPLVLTVCVSFPCGRRHVLLFRGLAGNFCNCGNGFLSLDPNQVDCNCAGINL
jgi:hypothetical protein